MKILSNPEHDSMICVLPNGVTVEVTQINLHGNKSTTEHNIEEAMHIVSKLPSAILNNKQNYAV